MIDHKDLIACAKESKVLTYDIEYEASDYGFHTKDFDLHGCGFSTLCNGEIIADYYTDRAIIQEIIDECFTMDIHCIAHFSQSDIAGLIRAGYRVPDHFLVDDTIMILCLLDENKKSYGLKKIAKSEYGIDMEEYKDAAKEGLDTDRFYKYGKLDVMIELKIFCDHYDALKESPAFELYRKVLMPSIRTFADIMVAGMHWDINYGRDLYLRIIPRIQQVEKRIYAKLGKVNIASPQQLSNRLFRDLGYSTAGLEVSRKTGAISLDKRNLTKLASKYKVCQDIITWRSLKKVISTYLSDYMDKMNNCGRVFGMYSLHSDTGRTRASKSNLQNVIARFSNPEMKDLDIRAGFVPPPGKKMIVSDFSGIELRVAAVVCQEPFFYKAFRGYKCGHCGTSGESNTILHACPNCGAPEDEKEGKGGFFHGADLHGLTRDRIPALKGDRNAAKVVNFSIVYGAGAYQLNRQYPSLSVEEWDQVIRDYLGELKGVVRYHKQQENLLKSNKESRDLFGRRRYVKPPRKTADAKKYMKEFKRAFNMIVNQPVQGPASALIQIAQNDLRSLWITKGWWMTKAYICNSVHDEIVVYCDEDIAEEAKLDVRDCMEGCQRLLDVPLRAEPKICNSWSEK
jgi:DNA polymerase-1